MRKLSKTYCQPCQTRLHSDNRGSPFEHSRDADLILVMDQGKVVQQGCHDELAEAEDSPYQKLFEHLLEEWIQFSA